MLLQRFHEAWEHLEGTGATLGEDSGEGGGESRGAQWGAQWGLRFFWVPGPAVGWGCCVCQWAARPVLAAHGCRSLALRRLPHRQRWGFCTT